MDTNRIKKYFSQKPKTVWTVIAAVLIAIGIFFIVILPWSFDAPGMALIAVGAVIFIVINLQIKDNYVSVICVFLLCWELSRVFLVCLFILFSSWFRSAPKQVPSGLCFVWPLKQASISPAT